MADDRGNEPRRRSASGTPPVVSAFLQRRVDLAAQYPQLGLHHVPAEPIVHARVAVNQRVAKAMMRGYSLMRAATAASCSANRAMASPRYRGLASQRIAVAEQLDRMRSRSGPRGGLW